MVIECVVLGKCFKVWYIVSSGILLVQCFAKQQSDFMENEIGIGEYSPRTISKDMLCRQYLQSSLDKFDYIIIPK